MIIQIHEEKPQKRFIQKAVEVLEAGGVIIYPTDTVYAYGCDPQCKSAIEKIYHLKKIQRNQPLSFVFADIAGISEYVRNISNPAFKIMKQALPGPYTFIFQASKLVPRLVLTKQKTIGVRVPDNTVTRELVQALGRPLISTSVHTASGEHIISPAELEKVYRNDVDLVIDCGKKLSDPSTVVDFSDGTIEIIRRGKGELFFIT
jgi:tRNA threonylcarbamoyl adenosine modification protein (Sua5/YciO/YrdC/YwlC family)